MDRVKKVALLGAEGFEYNSSDARVECFPWNQLNKVRNLADYDEVVLNLVSFKENTRLSGATLRNVLNVSTAHEILRRPGEGAIFVLGDRRVDLSGETDNESPGNEAFLSWTGFEFAWDDRWGTTLEPEVGPHFELNEYLMDKLDGWKYSLKACKPLSNSLDSIWVPDELLSQGFSVRPQVEPVLKNRYGNPLVFLVRHAAEPIDGGRFLVDARSPYYSEAPLCLCPSSGSQKWNILSSYCRTFAR